MVGVNKKMVAITRRVFSGLVHFSDKSNDVMQKNNYFNELQKKQKISLKFNIIIKRK